MKQFSDRFRALTPIQRELLARRLEKGPPKPHATESPATSFTLSQNGNSSPSSNSPDAGMQFSLFFFSENGTSEGRDKYRLILESAKYADEHGFTAIWTPERHFQDFGGLYPNPSVLSAAIAVITSRIHVRAGSVALPLHNPIRVAEEWSVVDNLSRGRVGVSFASGWHPGDFVLSPNAYNDRKEIMFQHIGTIKKLWAGKALKFQGVDGSDHEIKMLPTPVQKELPIWVTSSGGPQTWIRAGEIGANVLTALIGSSSSSLAEKIALYRESLAKHGHDSQAGCVTVMLHTFLGEDISAVREQVRKPLTSYLRTFIKQGDQLDSKTLGLDAAAVTEEDKDTVASFAFERFFSTDSLLGTWNKCRPLVEHLKKIGVNEIACLIDFGLDADVVIAGLHHLNELREHYSQKLNV
ncbi:MAG: siderophore biosynthesis protein [Acidobacteria bacterium]|nr:MAG: siderophore biosynthesis protein [Acidobacteriota bacterium]